MRLCDFDVRDAGAARVTRRELLKRLAAAVAAGHALHPARPLAADEVAWLADVQRPPERVPRELAGTLEPLLFDGEGRAVRTLAEWRRHRETLRERWLAFLGPMPEHRPAVRLTVLDEDRPAGVVRQLVEYEGEAGERVEGYLLRPANGETGGTSPPAPARQPGLVALHQTTRDTIDQIAGKVGPADQQIGLRLCRRGFVVFCPRCFLWQNAGSYEEAVARFRRRHPGALGMRKMLYDTMRAVDVLASLPDVDAKRLGACGHSLGAKETLYLAAFDERIAAAVASEGGIGFTFTNWDAPWYLGPAIRDPALGLNHHELLALIAPRAFLILAGESGPGAADGERTWPFVEAALPVYRLYGERARLGLLNHRQGHSIPAEAFDRMAEWLQTYLDLAGGSPAR